MKNKVTNLLMSNLLIVATLTSLSSCKKDFSASPVSQSISTTNLVSVTTPLGVALNGYANSTTDSVYVLYGGDKTLFRDEIPGSVLPASIQQYQTDNYQDYSQINSFTLIDIKGTVKSYLSVIRFNERPVALEFSIEGSLLKVLEQREKADLNNAGWHTGGLFENRDGSNRDNIDIATLPVDINDYFVNNYSQDIITRAFKTKEDAIVVLSKNNGVFANIFNRN